VRTAQVGAHAGRGHFRPLPGDLPQCLESSAGQRQEQQAHPARMCPPEVLPAGKPTWRSIDVFEMDVMDDDGFRQWVTCEIADELRVIRLIDGDDLGAPGGAPFVNTRDRAGQPVG